MNAGWRLEPNLLCQLFSKYFLLVKDSAKKQELAKTKLNEGNEEKVFGCETLGRFELNTGSSNFCHEHESRIVSGIV